MRILSRRSYASILIILIFLNTIPNFVVSLLSAENLNEDWAATNFWIESAECARIYGKLLVGCRDGEIVPFANISYADDPGHALLLGLYSLITGKTIRPEHISILNSFINYSAILLMVVIFATMNLRAASIFSLISLPLLANAFHAISPHPAQFGEALHISILPIAIIGLEWKTSKGKLWLVAGFFALFLALILRQSIGMMGIICSLISVAINHLTKNRNAGNIFTISAMAGIFLVAFAPSLLLDLRDVTYGLPKTTMIQSHGIWHNLYIGLGAVPNAFGIEWSDTYAANLVKTIDPTVPYVSETYYSILRDQYISTVMSNPMEVLRIYAEKLWLTSLLAVAWPITPAPALVLLPILMSGLFFRRRMKLADRSTREIDAVAVVSFLIVAAFLAQGAMINPSIQYERPLGALLVLCACCFVEYLVGIRSAPANSQLAIK